MKFLKNHFEIFYGTFRALFNGKLLKMMIEIIFLKLSNKLGCEAYAKKSFSIEFTNTAITERKSDSYET